MSYVPLRVHTDYSLLEAIIKPTEAIDFAIANNLPSIAITDKNNLFAAVEYSFYARKKGFPAILGCSLQTSKGILLLYAKNTQGYYNLCKILSDFYTKYNQVYPLDQLQYYTQGLCCITSAVDGVLQIYDEELIELLIKCFGDNFALELNRTEGIHHSESIIKQYSEKYKIPVVGTHTALFVNNVQAYQVVKAVNNGEVIKIDNKENNDTYKLLDSEQMHKLFQDCPIVLENTITFAQKCTFLISETKPQFPFFAENATELLVKWSNDGLEYLMQQAQWQKSVAIQFQSIEAAKTEYYARLKYELDLIISLGFVDYFLIVADFVKWAREQKISLSARGSGAGSLVAWCLFITCIDPIFFGLFFERFINPGRVSLPDFDIDFCQERRQEVIEYVQHKYGADLIAQIITFGAWHARGVLRDTGRVLGISLGFVNQLCKRIPNKPNFSLTLSEALEADAELKNYYDSDPQIKLLFDLSMALEGLHRHISIHAAGIIIGASPLRETIPLYATADMKIPATQYIMTYIEKVGLVKFDFLGLTALTIIDKTLAFIAQDNIIFDINQINQTDVNVYNLLCKGLTAGVFQFESVGLTNVIVRLQPMELEELTAVISLYRPGPMENIGEFIARKHGLKTITYEYECLKEILAPTFGIIVYQEQVIAIARVLAGYSLSEADLLRRAMGKKIAKEMEEQSEKFVNNVIVKLEIKEEEQEQERKKATELFDQILKFSGYAFNKAHAASHAFIGYQTAYLKTYYPLQFMTVSLTLEKQRHDKIAQLHKEFKALDLIMHKPDINISQAIFTFEKPKIVYYCLSAIKSIGDNYAQEIMHIRSTKPFTSVEDFCMRINPSKGLLDAFIYSGALDNIPIHEQDPIHDTITQRSILHSKRDLLSSMLGQSLFMEDANVALLSITELLLQEWKYIGTIISISLLQQILPKIDFKQKAMLTSSQVLDFASKNERQAFELYGLVLDKQLIRTKQGSTQWAVTLADEDGVYEIFVKSELHDEMNLEIGQTIKSINKFVKTYWIAQKIMEVQAQTKKHTHFSLITIKLNTEEQLLQIYKIISSLEKGSTGILLIINGKKLDVGMYKFEDHTFNLLKKLDVIIDSL